MIVTFLLRVEKEDREKVTGCIQFYSSCGQVLTDYCSVIGRSHVGMYDSFTILTEANNCFSTKVNHGRG